MDRTGALLFNHEEPRDQEAAEHEEYIHADESTGEIRSKNVVANHSNNGKGAKAVKGRNVLSLLLSVPRITAFDKHGR